MSADDRSLRVSWDGPVARLTLTRADRLNALDDGVRRALADTLHELEERTDIRVVVLAGDGRAFSAGADLRGTAYPPIQGDWVTRRHRTGTWQRLLEQLDRIPQATVARLHGHVVGGAALLAAACDLRVAADDVVLRIPELAIGIPLTWAGIPLLVREIGLPLTRISQPERHGLSGQLVEQPARTHRPRADTLDAGAQETVGGDHGDLAPPASRRARLLDDRGVPVPWRVHGQHMSVPARLHPALGRALEHQHDLVVRRVGEEELLVQPARGARAVLPPAVGPRADHVGGVDDQSHHLRNLEKSFGRSRAAAAFS